MGNLMDLNSQIPDSRIPSGIARDTETTAAINAHIAAVDPHPVYMTQTEGDARYRQSSVALVDGDIPAGIARDSETTAAINAHIAAADPHPVYMTQTEGDARYRQSSVALVDGDIPAGIARDSETTAAINAHIAAADPHPGYLTQVEGDIRYGLVKIIAVDSIRTASTEGQSIVVNHGLQVSKVLGFQAIVEPFTGTWVPPNWTRTPGAQFVINLDSNSVYITNISGNSFNILNKPVRIVIHHMA